ncbi:DNA alkylation repair protein [Solicola gregarius]|uniref:DNA alkylation repair protein n=1 Tax=Solicola gregarius TaxID=2908642 RepID=A0AA46YLG5_9ACTN|nr:DNA alkylation repair protein [Solicola gregarius]UYM06915.1 DNA alkylation repair protein [Solicola gregarius]
MTVDQTALDIVVALEARADPARAEREAAYLKSSLRHLGVRVPEIRSITRRTMREHAVTTRTEVVALAEELWAEPVHERRMAAVEALRFRVGTLTVDDLTAIERMLREAKTWALVDFLSSDIAGVIVVAYPDAGTILNRWAADDDFWIRRSALLSLLVPLRNGDGDWPRFSGYADAMLDEREFFIRKAIGWVLRDTAKKRPDLVEAWLRERPGRVPVLAVREAVKPLPERTRTELIAAALRR